jgi:preprotein translocase SecE subunit
MNTLKRFATFLRESWHEVRHQVTYPTWEEVKGTSIVVVIVTAAFAVFFSLVDLAMAEVVTWFFDRFA